MHQLLEGTVHGRTIELADDPNVSDGSKVEVILRPLVVNHRPGEGLLRTEGALADDDEWDAIMDEIQQSRKQDRRSQEAGE